MGLPLGLRETLSGSRSSALLDLLWAVPHTLLDMFHTMQQAGHVFSFLFNIQLACM